MKQEQARVIEVEDEQIEEEMQQVTLQIVLLKSNLERSKKFKLYLKELNGGFREDSYVAAVLPVWFVLRRSLIALIALLMSAFPLIQAISFI